jgi:DNA-binding beta-propeller fold protein YncE
MESRIRLAAILLVSAPLAAVAPGAANASKPQLGDTQVFARVPDPGQPAGIALDRGNVYVTTLGVAHDPIAHPQVFVYGMGNATLRGAHTVPPDMPANYMALYGIAPDRHGDLYVVDMNGRIIRLDPRTGRQEIYAEFPARVGGLTTMPFDLVFDDQGNAYVTDQNLAAIWRVGAGGSPVELWFQDPRLAGYLTGPSGITMDPQGTSLYFTVATSLYPGTARQGLVFRLPLAEPASEDLEEVFRYPPGSSPFDLVFGESGKLYVTLNGAHQVSVLGVDRREEVRFPSPEENALREVPYDRPMGLAFDGRGSLLVTNTSWLNDVEEHMVVFEVFVDDRAASK